MAERCVLFLKPLLDSGTEGTKGHAQVFVPRLTESYGRSLDQEEREHPLCTLRYFPSIIQHTLQVEGCSDLVFRMIPLTSRPCSPLSCLSLHLVQPKRGGKHFIRSCQWLLAWPLRFIYSFQAAARGPRLSAVLMAGYGVQLFRPSARPTLSARVQLQPRLLFLWQG